VNPDDSSWASSRPTLRGRVARVTLFEDRAEVTRVVTLATPAEWVSIEGVSPLLDDASMRARVLRGPRRVAGVRVLRKVRQGPDESEGPLEREFELARRALAVAEASLSRAEVGLARHDALLAQWVEALAHVPRNLAAPDRRRAFRRAYDLTDDAIRRAADALSERQADVEAARDRLARAEARLRDARVVAPAVEARLELQLEGPADETDVELRYFVPCALWRPEHGARLVAHRDGLWVEWTTWATAWQNTGESWDDVPLSFSTARPARAANAPMLRDDVLRLRRHPDAERAVLAEAREDEVTFAGLERALRHSPNDMPGVDDGGEPLVWNSPRPVTLPPDGHPRRIELFAQRARAQVERVLMPERSSVAHVRATTSLPGGSPLLAGPVRAARESSLVSLTTVPFVAAGDTFDVGFGPDEGLRVRRERFTDRDTVPVIGTQIVRVTVRLYLSSLDGTPRRVLINERVPITDRSDVEISVREADGWSVDPHRGLATRTVELVGHATASLRLDFEVRAPARIALPWLPRAKSCPAAGRRPTMGAVPRPGYDQVVLLTGYPSLAARRLLDEVLAGDGSTLVYAVVPQRAAAEAEEHRGALDRAARERVIFLDGDPASMDLGLSGAEFRQLTRELDYIHHCAQATYAGVDRRAAEQANVGATREVLELGTACQALRCLVHHSTAFVAGDRAGTVFEDELERGQRFRSVYEETKARAEKLVRAAMGRLPAVVLRPTNVVGDSTTGAVDRLEGPYLLAVLLLSTPADVTLPLLGRSDALLHVVPIDYVARAAALLGRDPRAVGKTFHLVDPRPLTGPQAFELVARAAGRRSPRGTLPVNLTKVLLNTPGLERFSYNPRAFFEQLTTPVRFDSHNADALLAGTGVRCPPFETYVDRMVAFVRERLRERREQRRAKAPDSAADDPLS
jgi:uncharacterized protein (TIGR02231 family)